jgi:hypothetical protein
MHRHWFRHLPTRERDATISRLAGDHWAGRAVRAEVLRQEAASAAAGGSL